LRSYSFWAGVIGGCFLTTASHGTEQLLVQRLLSAKTQQESRRALFASWFLILFQFSLFLVIGTMLFVQYHERSLAAPKVPERIYPEFLWNNLPPGAAGLVMAAILAAAMSNLSAALNALASTTVMDFRTVLRGGKDRRPESYYLRFARIATIVWGLVLFAIGLFARYWGRVLEAGLSIASVLYGALLGVFLLGLLTKKPGECAAIIGMCAGLIVTFVVRTQIAFTWYVLVGATTTFIIGWLAGFVWKQQGPGAPIA
jgi:solute:Na+ symporter, SSS family